MLSSPKTRFRRFVSSAGLALALLAAPAAALDEMRALVRADQIHARGYTGAGVTVAIIDSGVAAGHTDIINSIVGQQCFCADDAGGGCCPGGATTSPTAEDDLGPGHGTAMAGIVTSDGFVAPKGIAPDASIVAVKIISAANEWRGCDLELALQWLIDVQPDLDVVNMSFGAPPNKTNCAGGDAAPTIAQKLRTLRSRGVAVFAGAGNDGLRNVIAFPASLDEVTPVGAVWDGVGVIFPYWPLFSAYSPFPESQKCGQLGWADRLACFTNTVPRGVLLAPGIYATTTHRNGATTTGWGTSHATAATAACAALLLQADPLLTPARLDDLLDESGKSVFDDGDRFRRIDCLGALDMLSRTTVFTSAFESARAEAPHRGSGESAAGASAPPAGWIEADVDGSPSTWSTVGGELRGEGDGTDSTSGGSHDSILLTTDSYGPDLTLDLDLRYFSGVVNPGDGFPSEPAYYVILRYLDALNYIYLRINPVDTCSACGLGPDITIREVSNGVLSTLDSAGIYPTGVPPAAPSTVQSHLTVEMEDLRLRLTWDGKRVFEEFLPFTIRSAGKLGVGVPDGGSAATAGFSQFDNVTVRAPACSDGVDNDADGDTDYPADDGCRDGSAPSEATACSDGIDNDYDGLVDSGSDPDCAAAWRDSEAPAMVLPLFDDFNDGDLDGWSPVDADAAASTWEVSSGVLQGIGDGDQSAYDSFVLNDSVLVADLILDIDLRYVFGVVNPGDGFPSEPAYYVILRYLDALNYIYLRINPVDTCSACGLGPDITIREVVNGVVSTRGSVGLYPTGVPTPAPSTVQSHLKVVLEGSRIEFEWDDLAVYDQTLAFVNLLPGRLGFGVPDGASAQGAGVSQFDNVEISPIGADLLTEWEFSGTAQGGSVAFTVSGVTLQVTTMAGQTPAELAAAVAAAINADATLAGSGIAAVGQSNAVTTNGTLSGIAITDPGIADELPAVPVPALDVDDLALLIASIMGLAGLALRPAPGRRRFRAG